jgi:hypothetical protein
MRTNILMLAAAAVVASACGGSDTTTPPPVSKVVNFTASLTPGSEPSVTGNPQGSGTLVASLDTSTNIFTWNVQFSGLTANASLGHIHGPFPSGSITAAAVILNFDPLITPGATFTGLKTATSGSATGTILLTSATSFNATVNGDSLRKLLLAELTYANIHTATNPAGEIRGQILIKH